jgi:hypothetical protein
MATQRQHIPEVVRCQAYTDATSSAILPSRWIRCLNSATRVVVRPGMQPRLACDEHYRAEPVTWDYFDPIDPDNLPLMLLEELIAAEGQHQDWLREQICEFERRLRNARIRQQNASETLIEWIRKK